jgi:sec-independent protein translocase protein TatA
VNVGKDLLIVLFVALLIFGPKRIAEIGGAVGKSLRDFRRAMEAPEEEPSAPARNGPQGGQRGG